ncbi:MAG TPA: hypothetical protein VII47_04395 [Actinomycetota bacterium]|jgi:hypothetical protein
MKTLARHLVRSMAQMTVFGALAALLILPVARTQATQGHLPAIGTGDMRLVACDVPSGLVLVRADAPAKFGDGRVTFTGHVETPRDYCHDEVRILGQRKVCGAFGCNYRNIETSPYVEFDRVADLKLFADCQSGTHRYRTIVEYTAPNVRNPGSRFFVQDKQDLELTC